MQDVVATLLGFGAALLAFVFLVMVSLHSFFAEKANQKLLNAALTAFGVMLGFVVFFIAEGESAEWFPSAYYEWLGPVWIVVAIVLAVLVYGLSDKSDKDTFGEHLDKWNKWGG